MKPIDHAKLFAGALLLASFTVACEPEPTATGLVGQGADSALDAEAASDSSASDSDSGSEPELESETVVEDRAGTGSSDDDDGDAGDPDQDQDLTPFTVMLDWVPNTNHAGLYLALEEGRFREEGLAVEIIQPGEVFSEQAVAGGLVDVGVSFQEALTLARADGVPLVSIAAIIQHNTSVLASPSSLQVEGAADFAGLKYGSFGSPFETPTLHGLMGCAAAARGETVDVDSLEIVETGFSDPLQLLATGQIDLAWIFEGWQGIQAQREGLGLNYVRMSEHQDCIPDYYTPIFIASEKTIAERPKVLQAFLAAVSDGYVGAAERPGAAGVALLEAAPELDIGLVDTSMQWLAPRYTDDAPRWGEQRLSVWSDYALWLEANGIIKNDFQPAAAFTNDPAPGAMSESIEVVGVTKTFTDRRSGRAVHTLDDVSLTVGAGEIVALVGPSGSGKSTLLDLVAGLTTPDLGVIRQAGQAVDGPGRVGYMPQRDLLLLVATGAGQRDARTRDRGPLEGGCKRSSPKAPSGLRPRWLRDGLAVRALRRYASAGRLTSDRPDRRRHAALRRAVRSTRCADAPGASGLVARYMARVRLEHAPCDARRGRGHLPRGSSDRAE